MSASAMLEVKTILDIQPGKIPPVIHLKEGSDSMDIVLRIRASEAVLLTSGKAIVKGSKPNGGSLFVVLPISGSDADFIDVDLMADTVRQMTDVVGKYDCTISIIDSDNVISEADYEDYEYVTVQPFTADVEPSVAG